jgi:hypothetical protein
MRAVLNDHVQVTDDWPLADLDLHAANPPVRLQQVGQTVDQALIGDAHHAIAAEDGVARDGGDGVG